MSESSDTNSEATSIDIEQGEARNILETQVQLLRRLNDEHLRTLRIHLFLGGGTLTALSIIVSQSGFSILGWNRITPTNLVGWSFFTALFVASGWKWFVRLGSGRLSYTDLRIGSPESANLSTFEVPKRRLTALGALKSLLMDDLSVNSFEERIQRVEADGISTNALSTIEYNNRVLVSREKYVNTLQQYLFSTFVLTVLSLVGMIAI